MKFPARYSIAIMVTLLALAFSAVGIAPAYASTLTVTNNADSGPGSLRQAIVVASSGDTINFNNDYTITLASQLEIIDKAVTITGVGHHITISGNNAVRIFHVNQVMGSGNLTIDHLNIVNGASKVEECAGSQVACGGGLMLEYLTTATVLNSTFLNNDGGMTGGAIYSYYGNPLTVTNSTFINNHAVAYAGAIQVFYGSATLTNNTFYGNTVSNPGGYGGAILSNWGTVTFRNNIFAGNSAANGGNCNNSGGTFNDGGGNLIWGDTAYCPGVNANPFIGTLGDYGGDVPTIPLLPGSGAIDRATANCPTTDARGVARSATCDSGAYESRGFTLTKSGGDNQSTPINSTFATALQVTLSETGGRGLPNVVISFTAPSSGASTNPASFTATTDASGVASATATANGTVGGPYSVVASVTGLATTVTFNLTNNGVATTTTIASSANPSVFGALVTFTATVAPATATGTVTFKDGGTVITGCGGRALSSGQATCATTALTIGFHSITAEYGGDANYNASTSTLSPAQRVDPASTTTTLASSANPSTFGASVTFTATVAPAAATGTVTFKDGSTVITGCDTRALSSGQATCATTALTAGSHSITAEYGGDANYNASTGTLSPDQQVDPANTTAVLVTSANPSVFGALVTFTATVAPAAATGTVAFKDGSTVITGCDARALSSGQATCATTALTIGFHSITARYEGDTNHTVSISAPLPQVVKRAATLVTKILNTNNLPVSYVPLGALVHAQAKVVGDGVTTPTGNVTFRRYSSLDCTGAATYKTTALVSGIAQSPAVALPATGLSYQVNYVGDARYVPATGACVKVTPPPADLRLTLTARKDTAGRIVYTLTVKNAGPVAATNALVNDPLPRGQGFNSAGSNACVFNTTTRAVRCRASQLAAGASVQFVWKMNWLIAPDALSTNRATVRADQYDPVLTNNTATLTINRNAVPQ